LIEYCRVQRIIGLWTSSSVYLFIIPQWYNRTAITMNNSDGADVAHDIPIVQNYKNQLTCEAAFPVDRILSRVMVIHNCLRSCALSVPCKRQQTCSHGGPKCRLRSFCVCGDPKVDSCSVCGSQTSAWTVRDWHDPNNDSYAVHDGDHGFAYK